jgi:LmbE family N-acetylglucosaminyl deacetylase
MPASLKLMMVLAHPDDESLGTGATLAKYAAEGVETYLLTATRGQRGYRGWPVPDPGPDALGDLRETELHAAAKVLGLREVTLLNYVDGDLDLADPSVAAGAIAAHLRRVRPQVVVTFGPDGAYGHPDHIAISQFTTAAIVLAASPSAPADLPPHQVSKLYFLADPKALMEAYNLTFPPLEIEVDGVTRRWAGWDEWAITTVLDADAYWQQTCAAISCHRSQLVGLDDFAGKLAQHHTLLLGRQCFYRAMSLVNGGRVRETDLFAGLRSV